MPKDYQISQYDAPINVDGALELPDGSRVGIVRAHIEEDTGKTTHIGGGGGRIHGADHSLVDYNRAGVPLVEIVSAPDIRSAAQARTYVAELRAIVIAAGASDGRMEEGSLRVDANVSVRPAGTPEYGTRCEVKNLNSLRSLVRAIEHEAERQVAIVSAGGSIAQETRHFDENTGLTHSLRSKEEAYDYRYFPEPDLVPVVPNAELLAAARAGMGVMPVERRRRLVALVGSEGTAEQIQTVIELDLDGLVLAAVGAGSGAGGMTNQDLPQQGAHGSTVPQRPPPVAAEQGIGEAEGHSGRLARTGERAPSRKGRRPGDGRPEVVRSHGLEAVGIDGRLALGDAVTAARECHQRCLA